LRVEAAFTAKGRRNRSIPRSRTCETCWASWEITDVTFIRVKKLAFGPEARDQAIEAARRQLSQVILHEYLQAV
jgi:FMN-dependent NADH-azoreductase